MSKEYGYFEAMEEILKDKSKRFKYDSYIMFCEKVAESIKVDDKDTSGEPFNPYLNSAWIDSKWTLIEEKKNYNVRIYGINDNKLISSVNLIMTEEENKIYHDSKIVYVVCEEIITT